MENWEKAPEIHKMNEGWPKGGNTGLNRFHSRENTTEKCGRCRQIFSFQMPRLNVRVTVNSCRSRTAAAEPEMNSVGQKLENSMPQEQIEKIK